LRRARNIALTAFALASLSSGAALANGRFPSAQHVEVDPEDPDHIVLRTTYGLVTTRDGGERWEWVCEESMSFAGVWDPPIGILSGGALVAGLPDGLSVSTPDACDFSRKGPLEGMLVVDLSVDKKNPARALVLASTPAGGTFDTRLFSTTDGGATFSDLKSVLPANLQGLTVDLAPSDPSIVYVSGVMAGGAPPGVVLRSSDGGATFEVASVPGSDAGIEPFLGAVDPGNASRIYVRLSGAPGKLLVSDDGGQTFAEIFSGAGALLGFAISPDGGTLVVGGEKDGLWRSPTDAFAFAQASPLEARCLRFTDEGLYACATEALAGFAVGFSTTNGSTFSPIARVAELCGTPPCAAGTSTRTQCAPRWPILSTTLNTISCDEPDPPDAGPDAGTTSPGTPAETGGCGCALQGSSGAYALGVAMTTLLLLCARRRERT